MYGSDLDFAVTIGYIIIVTMVIAQAIEFYIDRTKTEDESH